MPNLTNKQQNSTLFDQLVENMTHYLVVLRKRKFFNPKQRKAKLLGGALLSQNPTTTNSNTNPTNTNMVTEDSHLLPRHTEKFNYLAPIRDIELKF